MYLGRYRGDIGRYGGDMGRYGEQHVRGELVRVAVDGDGVDELTWFGLGLGLGFGFGFGFGFR